MSKIVSSIVWLAVGAGLGIAVQQWWPASEPATSASAEKQPLYWVAPMDPNYRRDQPGKSPMGMDLIPVYDEGGSEESPGTVRISPEVVQNLGVRTVEIERQRLVQRIDTVGYIGYDEDRLVHVHPRVEGWVERLHVKAQGDPVQKGQPLYEIYSPALVSAQEEYLIALGRGNSRLIASVEQRLRALQVSGQEIARLKKTREVRQTITIYAPASGYVDNLNIREGNYVKPGNELMLIGPLDQVWLLAEVFERQAATVSEGDPVTMALDFLPGETWQGKVDLVYPLLDQKTRTLKVRVRFDNPGDRLKPNMFARVQIRPQSDEPQLAVPREAVIRSGGMERVVLAMGEGRFKSVEVTTGQQADGLIAIRDGLQEGDEVVVSAQFLLDSESSISSDFRRMSVNANAETALPQQVWAEAEVKASDPEARTVSLAHGPIPAWQWPAMTMDFGVDEGVDMTLLTPGASGHFQILRGEQGGYRIGGVHLQEGEKGAPMPQMDNGQMDAEGEQPMPQMDHSQMDHSQMNHAAMESGEGNHD